MLSWFKVMFPLIIEILRELFHTDGETKIGLGLKVSILVNLMLASVLTFITMSYFELYHQTLEQRVDIVTLEKSATVKTEQITLLESELKDTKLKLSQCSADTNPSGSYKHCEPSPPIPKKPPSIPEVETEEAYRRALLRVANG